MTPLGLTHKQGHMNLYSAKSRILRYVQKLDVIFLVMPRILICNFLFRDVVKNDETAMPGANYYEGKVNTNIHPMNDLEWLAEATVHELTHAQQEDKYPAMMRGYSISLSATKLAEAGAYAAGEMHYSERFAQVDGNSNISEKYTETFAKVFLDQLKVKDVDWSYYEERFNTSRINFSSPEMVAALKETSS